MRNLKMFPKTKYSSVINEDNYKCQGSPCTCKYEHNRTNYDNTQNKAYFFQNSESIGLDMKTIPIYHSSQYKKGYKYIGV